MDLSANEWNALKKAADSLKYDVKDKPSQLYSRVPTAPAQVLDEDEFYSIVEHIVKKAEEIEYYVNGRENRVKQLKTGKYTNTNSSSSTGSCCGEGSSVGHAAAVSAPVPVLSCSSERSVLPHDVCSSEVKVEPDTLHTAAAAIDSGTPTDSGTTAAEYRDGYATSGGDVQRYRDATAGYGDAYTYNGVPQQLNNHVTTTSQIGTVSNFVLYAFMQCTTQGVSEESHCMTSSVIGMQQQQLEQDDRLLCLRILTVDSDEVHQTVVITDMIITA
eukprot:7563-Heterococcus_DN1.PRE.3